MPELTLASSFFLLQVLGVFGALSCTIVSSLLFYLLSHVIYVGNGARRERAESLKRFLSTDSESIVFLPQLLLLLDLVIPQIPVEEEEGY